MSENTFKCCDCKETRDCDRENGLEDSCLYCSMPLKGNTSDEWMGWQYTGRDGENITHTNYFAGDYGVSGYCAHWQVVNSDGMPVEGELFENAWAAMDRAVELSR